MNAKPMTFGVGYEAGRSAERREIDRRQRSPRIIAIHRHAVGATATVDIDGRPWSTWALHADTAFGRCARWVAEVEGPHTPVLRRENGGDR